MNFSDLFSFIKNGFSAGENNEEESMMMALPTATDDLCYISGTSQELYNSHSVEDLGVWSDSEDEA